MKSKTEWFETESVRDSEVPDNDTMPEDNRYVDNRYSHQQEEQILLGLQQSSKRLVSQKKCFLSYLLISLDYLKTSNLLSKNLALNRNMQ